MRKILLSILSLFLFSCGTPSVKDYGDFEEYVKRFEQRSLEYGIPLIIGALIVEWKTLSEEGCTFCPVGRCTYSASPRISIDPDAWNYLSETRREALMFHELGHCVLKRAHRDDSDNSGRPLSIMHRNLILERFYKQFYDDYMFELFNYED